MLGRILTTVGNKIHAWLPSSIYSSDKEWEEEFEREIDAQVDAVFKMVKEMDDCAEPSGISADFDMSNDATFLKTLDSLNETMKNTRPKRRLSVLTFLTTLAVMIVLVRYLNPAIWVKE